MAEPKKPLEDVFNVSHNIKGQAGSFGYDIFTQIADRLCRIIENLDGIKSKELKVIELCALSMQLIVAQSGKNSAGKNSAGKNSAGNDKSGTGTNETKNQALLEGLDMVIAKFFPEQTAAANTVD